MPRSTLSAWIVIAALAMTGPACTSELEGGATERGGPGVDPGTDPGGGSPTTPDGKPRVADGCVITGCNDQLCSDRLITTECTPTPQDQCFQSAICERGDSGSCRWTPTDELHACLARAADMTAPDGGPRSGDRGSGSGIASDGGVPRTGGGGSGGSGGSGGTSGDCRQTGCFGELCADRDLTDSCGDWRAEYACYYAAECEEQPGGACGWTVDETLQTCLDIARGGLGGFGGF